MKKIIFVVIAVLLLSFAAVSAQETTTEEKTLTFSTIGDMISWTTTPEEIYNLLSEYNVEVSVEQDEKYGKTISASGESEDEKFMYVFYFDNDTEALWEVECAAMLYDGTLIVPVFQSLYEEYGFAEAEPYENESLSAYGESYDESYIVAGDSTIALLAGKAETEETYGQVALVLIDRNYYETH